MLLEERKWQTSGREIWEATTECREERPSRGNDDGASAHSGICVVIGSCLGHGTHSYCQRGRKEFLFCVIREKSRPNLLNGSDNDYYDSIRSNRFDDFGLRSRLCIRIVGPKCCGTTQILQCFIHLSRFLR